MSPGSGDVADTALSSNDPRWSHADFNKIVGYEKDGFHAFAWLKVGYARETARAGGTLGCRQELPPRAIHLGAPPPGVQLLKVEQRWLTAEHPDPRGDYLRSLVDILDREEVDDSDLVLFDWCSFFQAKRSDGSRPERTPLEEELVQYEVGNYIQYIATYSRIRTVVLLPKDVEGKAAFGTRLWPVAALFVSAYAQRLLYAQGPGNDEDGSEILRFLDPVRLANPRKLFFEDLEVRNEKYREIVFEGLKTCFQRMPPVPRDATGFRAFCERAELAWLTVRTVRQWAERTAFPFPRRQELPEQSYVVGAPPENKRKFVVSHGWESEMHPSPSGGKMRHLSAALLKLGADEEDLVFFDFCSNAQGAKMGKVYKADEPWTGAPLRDATCGPYFQANGVAFPLNDRSRQQRAAFTYAMWEMGRLYSYQECEVIVLPQLDLLDTFSQEGTRGASLTTARTQTGGGAAPSSRWRCTTAASPI